MSKIPYELRMPISKSELNNYINSIQNCNIPPKVLVPLISVAATIISPNTKELNHIMIDIAKGTIKDIDTAIAKITELGQPILDEDEKLYSLFDLEDINSSKEYQNDIYEERE